MQKLSNFFRSYLFTKRMEVDMSTSSSTPTAVITPLQDCLNPHRAYEKLKHRLIKNELEPLELDTPIHENKIRFVCISDTHNKTDIVVNKIPKADVLLHAGDFTGCGTYEEIRHFNDFLGRLNDRITHKVVIAGNHDLTFENPNNAENELGNNFKNTIRKTRAKNNDQDPRELLTNCIYLEDSSISLFGIKIYGAPWQPWFGGWAFNLERGQKCLDKWNKIPDDTDILITHGPPLGYGDQVEDGTHVGCSELLQTVQKRVKPKYHIFGHIHEDYGIWNDGTTTFINPSTCNLRYRGIRDPIIFDLDIPEGYSKTTWKLGVEEEEEEKKNAKSSD